MARPALFGTFKLANAILQNQLLTHANGQTVEATHQGDGEAQV